MKTMTGLQRRGNDKIYLDDFTSDRDLADNLNSFYLRLRNQAQTGAFNDTLPMPPVFSIDEADVANLDNICGRVLKTLQIS